MKRSILIGTMVLAAGTLLAADPKDEVTSAAKNLAEKANYSWKQTVENAGGGGGRGFGAGPSEGKVEKGGYLWTSRQGRDNNTIESVKKGEKAAMKTQDGWQSLADLEGDQGRGRMMARGLRTLKAPAGQILDLVPKTKEMKKDGDVYAADLTEDGAKSLLAFGGRGGGNGPEISGAKGSIKVWVKDDLLSKYEIKVQGTVSFNGNDRDVDRTTTVEIKDIGSTKIDVSNDAKKALE